MKDFFISYNSADKNWAEWIAWQLEETGYTTILQAWDFRPGYNFVLEMDKASKEAKRTIAVLSLDYLNALYTKPEWAAAFAEDPTGEDGTLLPVRIGICELKGLMGQVIYIDLVGLDEDAAKKALLEGIPRDRIKPSKAPGFPSTVNVKPRFPGALPPVWKVPLLRNPNFTGRESLLKDILTALNSGQPAALTQIITGLGGVGKTQLALEYTYCNMADYDVVWWVRAEEPATLNEDYASLAVPLRLPQKDQEDMKVKVEAVQNWLGQNESWLLVFDNAQSPNAVRDYIPQGGGGHVIITSRNPNWSRVAKTLPVQVFSRAESIEFIRNRTDQDDDANALADALGDLPLALEQAVAYIIATGIALGDYLELFRTRRKKLWEDEEQSQDYRDKVETTWSVAMDRVKDEVSVGAELLNLCAFLAPDDIPRMLFSEENAHLPESLADLLAVNRAVDALRRYSLIDASPERLSVHRLVQAVTRDRLSDEVRERWAAAAARLVNEAFPPKSDDVRTWPECSLLLPHALAAAEYVEGLGVAPEATQNLLNKAGMYLCGRAEFDEAKDLYERALPIAENVYGRDHNEVAAIINNIGLVLRAQSDLGGAKECFERALVIDKKSLGPDHPNVGGHRCQQPRFGPASSGRPRGCQETLREGTGDRQGNLWP
ncbi:MAG: FxSxx-COOH system tetratricopeptide repeat protein [Euryarchaeota archaeon]|nr:FxSxx-COOH system tetratricopeptide repeat protein [Euryarchaeota archaeon]